MLELSKLLEDTTKEVHGFCDDYRNINNNMERAFRYDLTTYLKPLLQKLEFMLNSQPDKLINEFKETINTFTQPNDQGDDDIEHTCVIYNLYRLIESHRTSVNLFGVRRYIAKHCKYYSEEEKEEKEEEEKEKHHNTSSHALVIRAVINYYRNRPVGEYCSHGNIREYRNHAGEISKYRSSGKAALTDREKAIIDLCDAIKIDNENKQAIFFLAYILADMHEETRSIQFLEQAVALDDAYAALKIARIYGRNSELRLALDYADRAIALYHKEMMPISKNVGELKYTEAIGSVEKFKWRLSFEEDNRCHMYYAFIAACVPTLLVFIIGIFVNSYLVQIFAGTYFLVLSLFSVCTYICEKGSLLGKPPSYSRINNKEDVTNDNIFSQGIEPPSYSRINNKEDVTNDNIFSQGIELCTYQTTNVADDATTSTSISL